MPKDKIDREVAKVQRMAPAQGSESQPGLRNAMLASDITDSVGTATATHNVQPAGPRPGFEKITRRTK